MIINVIIQIIILSIKFKTQKQHNNINKCILDTTEVNIRKPPGSNTGSFFTKNVNAKQKSASIDHLNLATCFAKSQLNKILTNINAASTNYINKIPAGSSYKGEFIREQSDGEEEDLTVNTMPNYVAQTKKPFNPPPNIQPYSGVLSKSLHSLVLKPQPLKPVVQQASKETVPTKANTLRPNLLVGSHTGSFHNKFKPLLNQQQQQPEKGNLVIGIIKN